MAQIDLGKIRPVWQGLWTANTAYEQHDMVKNGVNSYICTTAHTSGSSFSTTNWDDLAQGADIPSQTGQAGNFLQSDGSNLSWASASAGLKSVQVFTSSGTWTKPAGITKIRVYVTGGGGGGAGGDGTVNFGGGGAGGGTAIKLIDVSSVSSVSVTVGTGGAGGTANSGNANAGTTSSFGSYCSGSGGGRGIYWQFTSASGLGGTASGGDINIEGGDGAQPHPHDAQDDGQTAFGGSTYWGGGGQGACGSSGYNRSNATYSIARPGKAYGSGGGGGGHTGNNQSPGAAGKDGIVVIEEYA